MQGNVGEFYKNLKMHFGAPKIPDGVEERVFLENFKEDVGGFQQRVYDLAAKKLRTDPDAKRSFPQNGTILSTCKVVAKELSSEGAPTAEARAAKRDASSPEAIKEADDLLLRDRALARQAAREGWILDLHRFCAENNRLPVGCDADGADEMHDLRKQRERVNADFAEIAEHPGGSICVACATGRGGKLQAGSDMWEARCYDCGKVTRCSAYENYTWTLAGKGFAGGHRLRIGLSRLRRAIELSNTKQEKRIRELIGLYDKN